MKLSIITINLNNKAGLLRTLASVESQVDRQFEHVIVDGASTDGSVEVIKEYAARHDNVRWISEPDTGIYNAMNKAARMATADYLLYINSGDELHDSGVVKKFNKLECDEDLLLGEEMSVNIEQNRQIRVRFTLFEGESSLMTFYTGAPHQAVFIKRLLQLKIPYDESYRIAGDYHFFLKVAINNDCRIGTIDLCVSNWHVGGVSTLRDTTTEMNRAQKELLPKRIFTDYKGLTKDGLQLLKRLSKYDGFRKFVLSFADRLVDCYSVYQRIIKSVLVRK